MGIELFEASQRYNGWNGDGGKGVEVQYTHDLLAGGQAKVQEAIAMVSGRLDDLEEQYSDPDQYPRYQAIFLHGERALRESGLSLVQLTTSELSPVWVTEQLADGNVDRVVAVAGVLSSARNLAGRFQRLDLKVGAEVD